METVHTHLFDLFVASKILNFERLFSHTLDSPCQHGQCHDGINQYHCACSAGYKGRSCDIEIDECLSLPCLNNATCTDGIGNFSCSCALGYEGMFIV